MRTFISIDMDKQCRKHLASVLPSIQKDVKSRMTWVQPESWHLTLKFLGELETDRVVCVREALSSVRFDPFSVMPGNAGVFPSPQKPNVIWVGLAAGAQPCVALARSINEILASEGFPEGRPFLPHLTLGRIKLDKGDEWRALLKRIRAVKWPSFTVREFTLYKSVLSRSGARHTPLQSYRAGR